jgi:hypothetical protein
MSKLDEISSSFRRELDQRASEHTARMEADLQNLRTALLRQAAATMPEDVARRLASLDVVLAPSTGVPPVAVSQTILERQDLSRFVHLGDLDRLFVDTFGLSRYYPTYRLNYPTQYCETLEAFLAPMLETANISPEMRQAILQQKVEEARQGAQEHNGGGTFGYNLPAKGCYLNGWLFAYGREISPQKAFEVPELALQILGTAIHEKLGHGFIVAYSDLGKLNFSLGATLLDIARRFNLRSADDMLSSVHYQQALLLHKFTQLLEEGWASWLETYLLQQMSGLELRPSHRLPAVVAAVIDLPADLAEREEIEASLLGALAALFAPEQVPLRVLHQAVMALDVIGGELDGYFGPVLGRPLRYAVGQLLLCNAEARLGAACVPYAVLIAASVTMDPARIGMSDLYDLLTHEPHLNPDARLATLCQMKLEQPGSVGELAQRAAAELSFSVPAELKSAR